MNYLLSVVSYTVDPQTPIRAGIGIGRTYQIVAGYAGLRRHSLSVHH